MAFEAIWKADTDRIHGVALGVRGGRATTAHWGARLCLAGVPRRLIAASGAIANPRPRPSKAVTDRAALLADIAVRRRRAQMRARQALDAPVDVRTAEPIAS